MRKFLPLITLCVLGIIVVLLGIFAYRMASDTLVFAFYGQEEQFGDTMHIALDRPGTISRIFPAGTLLDDEAIFGSILYNEKSLDELPENTVTLEVGEGAIRIRGNAMEAGDTIRLSALLYNAQKRTSYKIPHDVLLTAQSVTRRVAITEKGNPKQTTFSVHMTGYDPMEADRIRWYEYSPIAGEGCESQGFLWNARNYRAVKAHKILSNTQSEKENMEYQVEYNPLKSRQCLIAGIWGEIVSVIDRTVDDFVITPGVSRVLTPEENLTSQVVFDFSQPIFSEYETQNEESMKKIHAALQKKISISPNVDIAASSFHITPQRIEITGVFQEGQEYRIHLTDIEDIYGHVASSVLKFTPENDAFLAVRMLPDTTEFLSGQPISARIYAVSPKKEAYTMKLCRLDVSGFVSVQKIVSQNSADTIKGIYDIMNSPHSSGCVKKDISLNQNDMMTDFSVSEMMDGGVLPEWLYILAFRDFEDIDGLSASVRPQVFSVTNSVLMAYETPDAQDVVMTIDAGRWIPLVDQEVQWYQEIGESEGMVSFATGVVLGRTNEHGRIHVNTEEITGSGLLIARGAWYMGYMSHRDHPQSKQSSIQAVLQTDQQFYAPGEMISIHAMMRRYDEELTPVTDGHFVLKIRDAFGTEHKTAVLRPNEFGTLLATYTPPLDTHGSIVISLEQEWSSEPISERSVMIGVNETEHWLLSVDLRGLNFDNHSPKNLRRVQNTTGSAPWYESLYLAPIQLELIVKNQFSFPELQKLPFSYELFEVSHMSDSWEYTRKRVADGSGVMDGDGVGYAVIATDFASHHHSVRYEIEVSVQHPLTGQIIREQADMVVSLPREYQSFDDTRHMLFMPSQYIIPRWKPLEGVVSFDGREWSDEFIGKYSYAIYKNEYTLRSMIFSGALNDGNVHIATDDFEMGEYEMEITPLLPQGSTIPLATIGRTKFFISENDMVAPLAAELISEKRAYAPGEMMRVSLLAPITTGVALVHIQTPHALITRHHTLSGSLTPLDIEIPQTSSQAVRLFALVIDTEKKQYFRAELPINIMQKRGVRIQADVTSQVYSRNEPIPIEISVSDQENAPIPSEVLVRIIPEGGVKDNIMPSQDLWQRSIWWIEHWLSPIMELRSSSSVFVWWEKPAKVSEVFIPHTALFYTGGIETDARGRAHILVPAGLPAGRHHLQVVSQSKDGYFGDTFDTLTIVEDFTVSAEVPEFAFANDSFEIPVSVRNHTDAILLADVVLNIGEQNISKPIILNIGHTERVHIPLKIFSEWRGNFPYTLTLRKGSEVLHHIDGHIWIDEIPNLGLNKKRFHLLRESQEIALSSDEFLDMASSRVRIRLGNTPAILIPGLLEEVENAKKTAFSEILESLIIRAYALRAQIVSERTTEAILQAEITEFLQPIQRETLHRARFSDRDIITFFAWMRELQALGFQTKPSLWNELSTYISEVLSPRAQNGEMSSDDATAILWWLALIAQKIEGDIIEKTQKEELSREGMLDMMESLLIAWEEVWDEIISTLDALFASRTATALYDKSYTEYMRYIRLLTLAHRRERAESLFAEMLSLKQGEISSLQEKGAIMRAAVTLARGMKWKPNTVTLKSLGLVANAELSGESSGEVWEFTRDKVTGNMYMEVWSDAPVYMEIREYNVLDAPQLFRAMDSENLSVMRSIERVDGVHPNGTLITSEVESPFLEVGKLYRIRSTVSVRDTNGRHWSHLEMRAPFPQASTIWLPAESDVHFQESWSSLSVDTALTRVENIGKSGDITLEYAFFFQPKISWSYLLPANFVYFREQKEWFANSAHQYLHIQ